MRGVSKAWSARLLAALTALALVVACVVGAYAHAVGHAAPSAEQATAHAGDPASHGHGSPSAMPKPDHAGKGHDGDGTGHSPLDCCDTICHGGQAILAGAVLVPHPALYTPLILSAAAFDGAEPAGPDRPPKPFRSA